MGSRILYFIFITSTIYLFLSLPLFADGIFGIAVDSEGAIGFLSEI